MKKIFQIILAFFSLALIAMISWGIYTAVVTTLGYFSGVSKELKVAIIAATSTVFVSTLTVVVGRYFERKKELDTLYRDKKAEIYDDFLKRFFVLYYGNNELAPEVPGNDSTPASEQDDLVTFLREFMRKLILISGPDAISTFIKWMQHLKSGRAPDAKVIFLTEELLLALRKDLRHSNRGIPKGFFAYLYLKQPDLFLAAAKQNPDITLAEVAILEAALEANIEEALGEQNKK